MKTNQATFPVSTMCRLLQVSTSGFYDWRDRALSAHERKDAELMALIHSIYERSHRTYGARACMQSCVKPAVSVLGVSASHA